jgi:hypothetical protein
MEHGAWSMEHGAWGMEIKGERRKLKVLTTEDTEFRRSYTELARGMEHGAWGMERKGEKRKEKGESQKG